MEGDRQAAEKAKPEHKKTDSLLNCLFFKTKEV